MKTGYCFLTNTKLYLLSARQILLPLLLRAAIPNYKNEKCMEYKDMMGNTVRLHALPQRIVSLVPSQTELLYDLGLEHEVVGITKFCVHPASWFRTKARVGGTKTVHLDKVKQLQPDLILANKEENTKEQVAALAADYPVWVSDIKTIADGLEMIKQVGLITGKGGEAAALASKIQSAFLQLSLSPRPKKNRVAYLIWREPWMAAGGDTFISDIIITLGWENALGHLDRYPALTLQELAAAAPDTILLSSEPYPFKEKHVAELRAVLPTAKIQLVDGEYFSWYGSRMLPATTYFEGLLAAAHA